jgi:hypothetical protein
MLKDVAFKTPHERVAESPAVIELGLAVKELMTGALGVVGSGGGVPPDCLKATVHAMKAPVEFPVKA